ncbi:MAG TPA: TAXI family TRAP transporter solute-binding subunit [Vicinamibacterales bacterium]|nr:TAXI family TRAP transporter solute-binding subunit [Vicinamibacterales bacterium]
MIEKRPSLAVVLMILMGSVGCKDTSASPPTTIVVRLAPGTSAPQLRETISRLPHVSVREVDMSGSIARLRGLRDGTIDLAAVQGNVSYLSLVGQLRSEAPFTELRAVAVLGLNVIHLFVREDLSPEVTSASQLRGLTVNLGQRDSGTALIAQLSLKAAGVELADIRSEFIPSESALKRLTAGDIDATFAVFVPETNKTPIRGARLVELDGPGFEHLRLQQPFVSRTLIPRATYPHQDRAIWTIAVDSVLVCHSRLDSDLVTQVLESYFARLGRSTAFDLERASLTSIPLHPAAARFFRRRELLR